MHPSIYLFTALFLFASHVLAQQQWAEYPAGIDPSKKYWPPGTGPPSKRWLQDLLLDAPPALPANNCSLNPHHHGLGLAAIAKLTPTNASEKFYWDRPNASHAAPLKCVYRASPLWGFMGKRAGRFECSRNTSSCKNIGQESFCCDDGTVCVEIPDTGYGVVGCCPSGQTCSGPLTGCGAGKQTCPDSLGGGCCPNDTVCSPMGCAPANAPTPTVPPNKPTCTSGYYACPTNVAGGCCPSGRMCGVSDCPLPAATAALGCPDGYHTCGSEFSGGCCRAGRGCGVTDCPPLDDTRPTTTKPPTIDNGIVGGVLSRSITDPLPAATTQPTEVCPTGWAACALAAGGGCCPDGYECGIANCPAKTLASTTLLATDKKPRATFVYVGKNNAAGKRTVVVHVVVYVAVAAGVVAGGL